MGYRDLAACVCAWSNAEHGTRGGRRRRSAAGCPRPDRRCFPPGRRPRCPPPRRGRRRDGSGRPRGRSLRAIRAAATGSSPTMMRGTHPMRLESTRSPTDFCFQTFACIRLSAFRFLSPRVRTRSSHRATAGIPASAPSIGVASGATAMSTPSSPPMMSIPSTKIALATCSAGQSPAIGTRRQSGSSAPLRTPSSERNHRPSLPPV